MNSFIILLCVIIILLFLCSILFGLLKTNNEKIKELNAELLISEEVIERLKNVRTYEKETKAKKNTGNTVNDFNASVSILQDIAKEQSGNKSS